MSKKTWDSLADDFEAEVLNVFDEDKHNAIEGLIDSHSPKLQKVADFGCGNGRGIPLLAKRAIEVYALDIAPNLVEVAKRRCRAHSNVHYEAFDLTRRPVPIPKVDAILSVNVLIMPSHKHRLAIIKNMSRTLKPGGTLFLVVPSLESQLWVYHTMFNRAQKKRDTTLSQARKQIAALTKKEQLTIGEGLVSPEGITTKFYLEHELHQLLTTNGFHPPTTQKLPYSWRQELLNIRTPKTPRPWHWLMAARKV